MLGLSIGIFFRNFLIDFNMYWCENQSFRKFIEEEVCSFVFMEIVFRFLRIVSLIIVLWFRNCENVGKDVQKDVIIDIYFVKILYGELFFMKRKYLIIIFSFFYYYLD